jgi:hypothetical protein
MADLKITQLTADTIPTSDDLVATVNDPAGKAARPIGARQALPPGIPAQQKHLFRWGL